MSRRAMRAVDATSALLGFAALAVALWPLGDADDSVAVVPPSLAAASQARESRPLRSPAIDSTAVGVVNGNVFSSTRRAPLSRFMPSAPDPSPFDPSASGGDEGMAGVDDYAVPASMAPDTLGGAAADATDRVPALYGIVGVDGVRRALLTLRPDEPPRLFGVGDRHAGYRISAITRDRVVLATPRGSRTLRLASSTPGDSSEILP